MVPEEGGSSESPAFLQMLTWEGGVWGWHVCEGERAGQQSHNSVPTLLNHLNRSTVGSV